MGIALVCVNTFGPEVYVWLFHTVEEAKAELDRQICDELEEQKKLGRIPDVDMEAFVHTDGLYGQLSTWEREYKWQKDTTEWRIGYVQN